MQNKSIDWFLYDRDFRHESAKPLMHGGNKRSFILKQNCNKELQVCFNGHVLLVPQGIKSLKFFRL